MLSLLKGRGDLQLPSVLGGPETLGQLIKEGVPSGPQRVFAKTGLCKGQRDGEEGSAGWSPRETFSFSLSKWQREDAGCTLTKERTQLCPYCHDLFQADLVVF